MKIRYFKFYCIALATLLTLMLSTPTFAIESEHIMYTEGLNEVECEDCHNLEVIGHVEGEPKEELTDQLHDW